MPVRAKLVIAALSLALLAAPYCSRAADVDAPGPTSVREATARLLKLATLHLGNPAGRGPEWLRALSRRS
ncbi:MAG TPA: hypothetical protein VMT50_12200, partial [Steroidobacteraceae bacterium]|nr:hypothetical protein [Steroidobacteraceae bacterium]